MDAFNFLNNVNNALEQVPDRMNRAFNNFFKNAENMTQQKVDVICRWLAWKVNIFVEEQRQKVIKVLYGHYQGVTNSPMGRCVNAIQSFVRDPIGAIGSYASSIFAPITNILKWVQMLIVEIPRLAKNIARIAEALPPAPPNPHINFNAFRVSVKTITAGEVMAGPAGLKSPEEIFPEPEKPFSSVSFNEAFDNATPVKKTILYGPQKGALEETIKSETWASVRNEIL